MNERSEDRADALFHALSDRTRRDILRRVLSGEHSVTTLAAEYDMSFAAVQKHVAVLETGRPAEQAAFRPRAAGQR